MYIRSFDHAVRCSLVPPYSTKVVCYLISESEKRSPVKMSGPIVSSEIQENCWRTLHTLHSEFDGYDKGGGRGILTEHVAIIHGL